MNNEGSDCSALSEPHTAATILMWIQDAVSSKGKAIAFSRVAEMRGVAGESLATKDLRTFWEAYHLRDFIMAQRKKCGRFRSIFSKELGEQGIAAPLRSQSKDRYIWLSVALTSARDTGIDRENTRRVFEAAAAARAKVENRYYDLNSCLCDYLTFCLASEKPVSQFTQRIVLADGGVEYVNDRTALGAAIDSLDAQHQLAHNRANEASQPSGTLPSHGKRTIDGDTAAGPTATAKADSERICVAVAAFKDDEDERHSKLILRLLYDFKGIHVIPIREPIIPSDQDPEESERNGHSLAREILEETGAHVLIWGRVLSHAGNTRPDLFMTSTHASRTSRQYQILPGREFHLPYEFWRDLSRILRLFITTRFSEIRKPDIGLSATELREFLGQLENVIVAGNSRYGWDENALLTVALLHVLGSISLADQTGDTHWLPSAIRVAERLLQCLPQKDNRTAWMKVQFVLGIAHKALGDRQSNNKHLVAAETAFRNSLTECCAHRDPVAWSHIQGHLGETLRSLGRRLASTKKLKQAVAAHRESLESLSRSHHPLRWADEKIGLAAALIETNMVTWDTAVLEPAIAAIRESLELISREQDPDAWVRAQSALGLALLRLGQLRDDPAAIESALEHCRLALENSPRTLSVAVTARNQCNLAHALNALGERDSGTAYLEEAITVCSEALTSIPRQAQTRVWSQINVNLGLSCSLLAERIHDRQWQAQGVAAFRAALSQVQFTETPVEWIVIRIQLSHALRRQRRYTSVSPQPHRGLLEAVKSAVSPTTQ